MSGTVETSRAGYGQEEVGRLSKGEKKNANRMAKEKGVALTIIVDIIHVTEYLWKAGRVFHPKSGPELEGWVRHRLLAVLKGL